MEKITQNSVVVVVVESQKGALHWSGMPPSRRHNGSVVTPCMILLRIERFSF
jgi:hypothetical protein